jgi:hypothetical protein
MKRFMEPVAYHWGRIVTSYTLRAAPPGRARLVAAENLPREPVIFIGWHAANLIELTLMVRLSHRHFCSFVPDGIVGAAMRGMLDRVDVDKVDLLEQEPGGVRSALRSMVRALFEEGGGQEAEIFAFASDVEADQAQEIARMRTMLVISQ